MFEGVVAYLLNKYIGKYVKDFDAENLNIGIFSGTVQLTDLQLKPEALYELDLPIEVIEGCIKKISIDIPWTTLYSDPILVHLEDILILASPISDRPFDSNLEKRLIRAKKHKIIEDVKENNAIRALLGGVAQESKGFFENLVQTVVNNVQISMQNVHIRYEDRSTRDDGHAIACGLAFQGLTAITTNSKWKPTQVDSNSANIFKLVKLETFYLYCNPKIKPEKLVKNDVGTVRWASIMEASVFNCSLKGDEFDFVLKPLIAKLKLIYNKSRESRVPKLLVDCVLQDASIELSQEQYSTIIRVVDNFQRLNIFRRYQKYIDYDIQNRNRQRWLFAVTAVKEEFLKPYSWNRIKTHRENYREYKFLYKEHLLKPNDAEIKVDLQIAEDKLDVASVIVAQEDAKLEIAAEQPSFVETVYDEIDTKESGSGSGWRFWLGLGLKATSTPPVGILRVKSEKESLWSKLTSEEQEHLKETISSFSSGPSKSPDSEDQFIAHKINFTLANITVSLFKSTDSHEKEIFVASLNQLLASLETRPSVRGYKVSIRTETLIVEGLAEGSSNYELIPIISADKTLNTSNVNSGHKTYIFGIDFEKNPPDIGATYSLTGRVEPIEILYQHQSISELLQFFIGAPSLFTKPDNLNTVVTATKKALIHVSKASRSALYKYLVEKQPTLFLNLDIKSPYIVIPELGALEKTGKILVVDFGRILLKSDIQSRNAFSDQDSEGVTASEMEEKLYDRVNLTVSDVQVLFSDTNDEWRSAKEIPESEVHIMPRLHIHSVFSRSLRPDLDTAPEFKLNVAVAGLKLNLSDRRIRLLCGFLLKIPVPSLSVDTVDGRRVAHQRTKSSLAYFDIDSKTIQKDLNLIELKRIRYTLSTVPNLHAIVKPLFSVQSSTDAVVDTGSVTRDTVRSDNDQDYSASDVSDFDESEIVTWIRSKDQTGTDDNISPTNSLRFILRFTVGEIVVYLSRSSDVSDKPYIMLRAEKLKLDVSFTTFGLVLQAGLRKLQLVDKQSSSLTGGYLELIDSESDSELVTLHYRKVKASCPDFKSHFHQIEHFLVLDVSSFLFTFHRESIITMWRYVSYVIDNIPNQFSRSVKAKASLVAPETPTSLMIVRKPSDPPIPSGATKLSVSFRLGEVMVNLCETEMDFARLQVKGFKFDFVQKANEKYVVRADLSELNIYDATEDSLYTKIFYLEGEDKLFDLKYVQKSPCDVQIDDERMDLQKPKEPFPCDGSFRLRVGRLHFVMLFKFMAEAYHFISPFIEQYQYSKINFKAAAARSVEEGLVMVSKRRQRIQFDIKIKGPSILIPQKIKSPNVVVCNLGELTMENFFSELNDDSKRTQTVDHMLIRLFGFELYRGTVQITENDVTFMEKEANTRALLSPVNLQVDIKQALCPRLPSANIIPLDINANVEPLCASISQTDLNIFTAIYQENIEEGLRKLIVSKEPSNDLSPNFGSPSHAPCATSIETKESEALASFLSQSSEVSTQNSLRMKLEAIEITLHTTPPINTPGGPTSMEPWPLCKIEMNDITLSSVKYGDQSVELKLSLQNASIDDIRKDTLSYARKIFQAHNPCAHPSVDPRFSISAPPLLDLTFRKAKDDGHVDVMVERTRFNVSVSFVMSLYKFVATAFAGDVKDMSDISLNQLMIDHNRIDAHRRLPSDITSGFHSNYAEESTDTRTSFSVSAVIKKVDILLYCDPCDLNTRLIILRFDSIYDHSRAEGAETTVISFVGVEMMSCMNGKRSETASMILYPTDLEATIKRSTEETEVSVHLSDIDARLSAWVIKAMLALVKELNQCFKSTESVASNRVDSIHLSSLWQPKKIYADKWLNSIALRQLVAESGPADRADSLKEVFTLHPFDIKVYLELNKRNKVVPIMKTKSTIDLRVRNWSHEMYLKSNINVEVMYFNQNLGFWEPFLEPFMEEENKYRPVEVTVVCVRDIGYPISCRPPLLDDRSLPVTDTTDTVTVTASHDGSESKAVSLDDVSSEESDPDSETCVVKAKHLSEKPSPSMVKSSSKQGSLKSAAVCMESSDSETEDGVFGKLATVFSHLISDQSSEDERAGDFSEEDDDDDDGENSGEQESEFEDVGHSHVSSGDGSDPDGRCRKTSVSDVTDQSKKTKRGFTNYCLLTVKDKLDFSVTPDLVQNLLEFMDTLNGKTNDFCFEEANSGRCSALKTVHLKDSDITVLNLLGPEGIVRVLVKEEDTTDLKYRSVLELSGGDSCPSKTPSKNESEELDRSKSLSKGILINLNADEETEETSHLFDIDQTDSCFKTKALDPDCVSLDSLTNNTHYYEPHLSGLYEASTRCRLSVEIAGFEKMQLPLPQKTIKAVYPLKPEKGPDHGVQSRIKYFVAISADVAYGLRTITVSSPLLVENRLGRPVLIMCLTDSLQRIGAAVDDYARNPFHEKYVQLASLDHGCTFNIPLLVAYHCQLFLQPITLTADEPSFELSSEGLWWQEIVTSVTSGSTRRCKFVKCLSAKMTYPDFWIKVVPKHNKKIKAPTAGMKTIPNLTLQLFPPVVIHNSLCFSLSLTSKKASPGEDSVQPSESSIQFSEGETVSFFSLNPKELHEFVIEIANYIGCQWRGKLTITGDLEDEHKRINMSRFVSEGSSLSKDDFSKMKYRQLALGVYFKTLDDGALHIYLYSGYWIANKTCIPCVQLRSSGSETIYDLPTEEEPLLFNFVKRKQNKVKLRVNKSSWSSAFSLDTAGNQGVVSISDKERRKKYRFIVDIQLSKSCPLTKIVVLKPYFLVSNSTELSLSFMEDNDEKDLWIDLDPMQTLAYYPDTKSMKMTIKQRESKIASHRFRIDIESITVLRMDTCQALTVEVIKSENDSTVINVRKYCKPDIPVRIENYCEDVFIKIHQKQMGQTTLLSPFQSICYTWDDPAADRVLMWNVYNRKGAEFRATIEQNGYGQELVSFQSIKQFSVPNRKYHHSYSTRRNVGSHHRGAAGRRKSVPVERYTSDSDDDDDDDDNNDGNNNDPTADDQSSGRKKNSTATTGHHYHYQSSFSKKKQLRKDRVAIYWVSYIDGVDHQRVLLFTQDERIAKEARKGTVGQISKWEQFVSFHAGLGISIVTSSNGSTDRPAVAHLSRRRHHHHQGPLVEEVAYVNISGRPAIWEIEISHKWKPLTPELSTWLEDQWSHSVVNAQLKGYLEADLSKTKMHISKPFYGKLRRTCHPPIWIHLRLSKHYVYGNLRIQRIQIDNQLGDALFPVVLLPTPNLSPNNISSNGKPFLECTAFVFRETSGSCSSKRSTIGTGQWSSSSSSSSHSVYIIKYLKTHVEEFNLNLDTAFLWACNHFYHISFDRRLERGSNEPSADDGWTTRVSLDLEWINNSVNWHKSIACNPRKRIIIEYLHLSPLRLHFSFTSRHGSSSAGEVAPLVDSSTCGSLLDFVDRLGASVTDITDVTLNFIPLEIHNQSLEFGRLLNKIRTHYWLQTIRQCYVFILGLDILGNSFGILNQVSKALSNYFSEPCTQQMSTPDKYSTNISMEVLRTMSYIVEADARVNLANVALSFPFEIFAKKRKLQTTGVFLKSCPTVPELLTKNSSGLVSGIVLGISGHFTKTHLGLLPEDSVETFFKGTGKGFFGLIKKQGSNVYDAVNFAWEGIRRSMETEKNIAVRSRLPRAINPVTGLKPFSPFQAKGCRILRSLKKPEEIYWCHATLFASDRSDIALVTMSSILLLTNCRYWGTYDIEWILKIEDLMSIPTVVGKSLILKVGQYPDAVIDYQIDGEAVLLLKWLKDKIEELILLRLSDKLCLTLY